jgi:hypothetical protein
VKEKKLQSCDQLNLIKNQLSKKEEERENKMLTTTLITLITILERLLASGTLTTALAAIFRKALSALGVY